MPSNSVPQPQATLAIIFGASKWPDCPKFKDAPSLERSSDAFIEYLRKDFGLPLRNIKSLFNWFDDAAEQLAQAQLFVEQRRREGDESGTPLSDLLVYYAGHGDFERDGRDFYLTIRRTHKDRPLLTSITADSLGDWVLQNTRDLRNYLIIDCCFAAAVAQGFQTSPRSLAELRLHQALREPPFGSEEELPSGGIALLAAAGNNDTAFAPLEETFSRFTGVLLETLREGHERLGSLLSLSDVHSLVYRRVNQRYPEGARPELRPLHQRHGRVELVGLFRNPAFQRRAEAARPAEEERRKAEGAAEATRLAEEKRKAEEADAARVAEERRKAEEAAEATRLAEEKRKAEEAEAARLAEEKRQADEAARLVPETGKADKPSPPPPRPVRAREYEWRDKKGAADPK